MTDHTSNLQNTVNNALQAVLNSSKRTSILLWDNQNPKNSFILKDREGKRYLGLPRKDRKGASYWKFKEIGGKKQSSLKKSPVMDKVAKFEQRQEKAKEYANHANPSKE